MAQMAESDARRAKIDARVAEMDRTNTERFARIEALLLEHNRILEALPEVIRDKIALLQQRDKLLDRQASGFDLI